MRGIWAVSVLASILILGGFGFTQQASAATVFSFPDTEYRSVADIPAGFYAAGSPTALEDFEDHSLDFGITYTSNGGASISWGPFTDSVDFDDGTFDHDNTPGPGHAGHEGGAGHSFFIGKASPAPVDITFTFPSPVVEAALVWTDGRTIHTVIFEAFGPDMVSLGSITKTVGVLVQINGETFEDRFFGVKDPSGIIAIKITDFNDEFAMEVDHIQYGSPVIAPATITCGSGTVLEGTECVVDPAIIAGFESTIADLEDALAAALKDLENALADLEDALLTILGLEAEVEELGLPGAPVSNQGEGKGVPAQGKNNKP